MRRSLAISNTDPSRSACAGRRSASRSPARASGVAVEPRLRRRDDLLPLGPVLLPGGVLLDPRALRERRRALAARVAVHDVQERGEERDLHRLRAGVLGGLLEVEAVLHELAHEVRQGVGEGHALRQVVAQLPHAAQLRPDVGVLVRLGVADPEVGFSSAASACATVASDSAAVRRAPAACSSSEGRAQRRPGMGRSAVAHSCVRRARVGQRERQGHGREVRRLADDARHRADHEPPDARPGHAQVDEVALRVEAPPARRGRPSAARAAACRRRPPSSPQNITVRRACSRRTRGSRPRTRWPACPAAPGAARRAGTRRRPRPRCSGEAAPQRPHEDARRLRAPRGPACRA